MTPLPLYTHRRLGLIGLLLAGCALAWDVLGLDLALMHHWGTAQGFALKHNLWLETWLHDRIKSLLWVAYIGLAWMAWRPRGPWRRLTVRERWAVWVGITIALVATALLKRQSLTSCPWDLAEFGGGAAYVSHWWWGVSDGGPGHCFPSGHASSALAFVAVVFPWLGTQDARSAKHGWVGLLLVLAAGAVLGAVQTLRGAHYPSHTLWTAVACWFSAWAVWHTLVAQPARRRVTNPNPDAAAGTQPYR